jgi:hypothetical protein
MSTRRFQDALWAQQASNPMGLTNGIIRAMKEVQEEDPPTDALCRDPAITLMAYQLAYLTGALRLDNTPGAYDEAYDICQRKAQESWSMGR